MSGSEKVGLGVLLGMMLNAGISIWIFHTSKENVQYQETKELLVYCEKELPRNDQCVLMAVPESKLKIKEKTE